MLRGGKFKSYWVRMDFLFIRYKYLIYTLSSYQKVLYQKGNVANIFLYYLLLSSTYAVGSISHLKRVVPVTERHRCSVSSWSKNPLEKLNRWGHAAFLFSFFFFFSPRQSQPISYYQQKTKSKPINLYCCHPRSTLFRHLYQVFQKFFIYTFLLILKREVGW